MKSGERLELIVMVFLSVSLTLKTLCDVVGAVETPGHLLSALQCVIMTL